jgi:hypothetical protein
MLAGSSMLAGEVIERNVRVPVLARKALIRQM